MPPAIYEPLIAKEQIKDPKTKDHNSQSDYAWRPGQACPATGNVHHSIEPEEEIYREIIKLVWVREP